VPGHVAFFLPQKVTLLFGCNQQRCGEGVPLSSGLSWKRMNSSTLYTGLLSVHHAKYYAWIPRKTRNDGSAFMRAYCAVKDAPHPVVAENVAHQLKRTYTETM
jgi:hypothetical protein